MNSLSVTTITTPPVPMTISTTSSHLVFLFFLLASIVTNLPALAEEGVRPILTQQAVRSGEQSGTHNQGRLQPYLKSHGCIRDTQLAPSTSPSFI